MTARPVILLVDSSASDVALSTLLLERDLPQATITAVADALSFAEALSGGGPDVAIIAPKLAWVKVDKLLGVLRRRSPDTAIILFGDESDIVARALQPGLAFDGILRKGSAGFMGLTALVSEVLARSLRGAPSGFDIDDLPVPAFGIDAQGVITAANAHGTAVFARAGPQAVGSRFESWLADDDARRIWRAFLADPAGSEIEFTLNSTVDTTQRARLRRITTPATATSVIGVLEVPAPALAPAGASASAVTQPAGSGRTHQEMRDIALVFSHDLKEPMQQIVRLVRRAEATGEEGQRAGTSLQQVLDCASRASRMLDGMLEYLTVVGRDNAPTQVDLNVCLEHALDNLRGAIDESNADIISDHLPMVIGDEYQVLHLFQNLVSNAIKFHGRERPQLRISVATQGNDWVLAFRDNGIGIAQSFTERIFEMGQRLHTRDEYPGSGIGLALCKRIVERLGGRIWVESADGAGSTFYILLPRAPSHAARDA